MLELLLTTMSEKKRRKRKGYIWFGILFFFVGIILLLLSFVINALNSGWGYMGLVIGATFAIFHFVLLITKKHED